jgi:hypothetical protein
LIFLKHEPTPIAGVREFGPDVKKNLRFERNLMMKKNDLLLKFSFKTRLKPSYSSVKKNRVVCFCRCFSKKSCAFFNLIFTIAMSVLLVVLEVKVAKHFAGSLTSLKTFFLLSQDDNSTTSM